MDSRLTPRGRRPGNYKGHRSSRSDESCPPGTSSAVHIISSTEAAATDAGYLGERKNIREEHDQQVALFACLLDGSAQWRHVQFTPTAHGALLVRDDKVSPAYPDLVCAWQLRSVTLVLAVAEHAIARGFQTIRDTMRRMIIALPPFTRNIRFLLDFGSTWHKSMHLAVLQLRDFDIGKLLADTSNLGERIQVSIAIRNPLPRTNEHAPSRQTLGALLPAWAETSLRKYGAVYEENEDPVDIFDNFRRTCDTDDVLWVLLGVRALQVGGFQPGPERWTMEDEDVENQEDGC